MTYAHNIVAVDSLHWHSHTKTLPPPTMEDTVDSAWYADAVVVVVNVVVAIVVVRVHLRVLARAG